MHKISTIKDVNISKKTIILRVDFNVPVNNNKIIDNTRIINSLPTIEYLLQNQCKIIILTHRGRPEGKISQHLSNLLIKNELSKLLDYKIKFIDKLEFKLINQEYNKLNYAEILLLENIRFHPSETNNNSSFVKELASLADIYVNDSFSCSHREHASIHAITQFLPSYIGFNFINEVTNIDKFYLNAEKPLLSIIGGSKINTKLSLLNQLIIRSDYIFIGGKMANNFLAALGHNINRDIIEKNAINIANNILHKADKANCKIYLALDVACEDKFLNCLHIKKIADIKENDLIYDIGPATIKLIDKLIANSKTILWNGPVGLYENEQYAIGSINIARLIAENVKTHDVKAICGGGDTLAVIKKAKLCKDFNYLSTAGGAFLEFLSGYELPGIKAIQQQKSKTR